MSDGSLILHKGCVNASFSITQAEGKDGLIHLAGKVLDELKIGWNIKPFSIKGKVYLRLNSKVHPFLTTLYHRIYIDGRRGLDPHAFKMLDWEALSLMYMSDGSIQRTGEYPSEYAMINLCRLSYQEFQWFQHQLHSKLGQGSRVYKCGKYWRLGMRKKESEYFFEHIRPYILPEYLYKLPTITPTSVEEGEEIVCSVQECTEGGRNDQPQGENLE